MPLQPTAPKPLPATGYGPTPSETGLLNPRPPTALQKSQAAQTEQQQLLQVPGDKKPRFTNPLIQPKPGVQPATLGEGGQILAGAAVAEAALFFGLAPTLETLATITIGGLTAQAIALSNIPFLISPTGRKLLHFGSGLVLPHTDTDPNTVTRARLLGVPWQDIPRTASEFEERQLRNLFIQVIDRAELDVGRLSGEQQRAAQAILSDLERFQRTFKTTTLGPLEFIEPNVVNDLGRLFVIRRDLEKLEREYQLLVEGGMSGPLQGVAVNRGDKADP